MSHHEAQKIKRKLAPFMSLLLALACMGLLASCGGGEADTKVVESGISSVASNDAQLPVSSSEVTVSSNGIPTGREITKTEQIDGIKVASHEVVTSTRMEYAKLKVILDKYGYKLVGDGPLFKQIDIANDNINDAITKLGSEGINASPNSLNVGVNVVNDTYSNKGSSYSWGIRSAKIDSAWEILGGSLNLKVGVIDGGFRFDHEDMLFQAISSKFWSITSGAVPNYCIGASLEKIDDTVACKNANHGMNVASIIAGVGDNAKGIAGVAYKNTEGLIAYKTDFSGADIFNGVISLLDKKARIVNMSLGISYEGNDIKYSTFNFDINAINGVLATLADYYHNDFPDALIVQSAGNDGDKKFSDTGIPIYADYNGFFATIASTDESLINAQNLTIFKQIKDRTLVVGAYDANLKIASYSGVPYSTSAKGAYILAPGGNGFNGYLASEPILSIDSILGVAGAAFISKNSYSKMHGTSQATPHVTGVAALVWQANPRLSASQVRNIILTNSDTVDGYRALNAEKAVRAALDTLTKPTVSFTFSPAAPKVGEEVTFTANASSSNGAISLYSWSFGDGATSLGNTTNTIKHTFTTTGNFAVFVNVQDVVGAQAKSDNITITPVSPTPTPTVTGITAPSTLTVGVNATFSINGSNLPTTENLVITPSGVGCTGFGYGTRSAIAHTFACTPSAAGSLSFAISTASGQSLGTFPSTPFTVSAQPSASGTFVVNASDYPGVTFTNPFANPATCIFTATGNWRMGTQSPVTDANGNTTAVTYPNLPVGTYGYYVVPSAYAGSLVIQRSATSGEFIGTSKQVNFSGNEVVKFLANDVPWPVGGFSTTAFVDNSGSMSVAYSCQ